jgi:hypothetical protein
MNAGCQFLHEPGEEADSFTKDELIPQSKVSPKPNPFPTSHFSHGPTFKSVDDPYTKDYIDGSGSSALPQSAGWAIKKTPGEEHVKFPNIPPPTRKNLLGKSHDSIMSFVQPLTYSPASPSPLVLSLAKSGRQPKYTGPFDPFRDSMQFIKPITNIQQNMDSNLLESKENMSNNLRSERQIQLNDSQMAMMQVHFIKLIKGVFSF